MVTFDGNIIQTSNVDPLIHSCVVKEKGCYSLACTLHAQDGFRLVQVYILYSKAPAADKEMLTALLGSSCSAVPVWKEKSVGCSSVINSLFMWKNQFWIF